MTGTSMKVASTLLAGALALGLSGAAALADEASGASEEAGAGLETLIEELAASDASEAATATTDETEGAVIAFKTVSQGPISFQVGESWVGQTQEDGDVGYGLYFSDSGILQVITLDVSAASDPDGATDEFLASMDGDGLSDLTVTASQDRTLDGVLIRDAAFTATSDGEAFEGLVTFVFGSDSTAILVSIYADDGSGLASFEFQQAHRSVTFAAGETGSSSAAATTAQVATGAEFEFEGFQISVDDNPDDALRTSVETGYGDEMDGVAVIGVSVSLTNVSGETAYPPSFYCTVYGPDGISQSSGVGYYFEDSLELMGKMRAGATATGVIYMVDCGAGDYVIEFDDWSGNVQEVTVTIS